MRRTVEAEVNKQFLYLSPIHVNRQQGIHDVCSKLDGSQGFIGMQVFNS